ncbi:unnamed protein product [Adineta steineri]|uniref:Uncharacterized protein n=1 Tax=Adineta steineri TaxID=433720 RepID=A0A813VMN3_9BILA|nr:unnamed protein product [Adineta steineri]CAF1240576.1 unnamed protein product [Adineta steineri]
MDKVSTISNNNHDHSIPNDKQTTTFARSRWFHVLALADQLRQNTELKKNEQLRQYAFDIPVADKREAVVIESVEIQADHVKSFQHELLFAKTGNFNLDNLSENFSDLKRTFNRMLDLNNDDLKQVKLATTITKTALLMVLRATESIVEIKTNGTRKFPTLSSIISYIRSHGGDMVINGQLLVEWYKVAQTLDLIINDPDWLVQPRKAHWAMQVCNETLAWARGVFNENYRKKSIGRPIFDRDDSIIIPEGQDK